MAKLGPFYYPTSGLATLYLQLWQADNIVNATTGVAAGASSGTWDASDHVLSDTGHAKHYFCDVVAAMPTGRYWIIPYIRIGASPAITDKALGPPSPFDWSKELLIDVTGQVANYNEGAAIDFSTDLEDDIATLAARLSAGSISLVGGVIGYDLVIRRGDAYNSTTGRTRVITKASGDSWPSTLSGWTISFYGRKVSGNTNTGDSTIGPITCTAGTLTGDSQTFQIDLTAAQTTALAEGRWTWSANAVSALNKNTLASGNMIVQPEYPAD